MKITRLFLYGALGAFLLNSCTKDDDSPDVPVIEGDYTDGFFVLNEGSQTAGTVTYVSSDLSQVEQEIFAEVNEGEDLGNFAQSMFFTDEYAYIISNGSNLITVVDRYTFELVGTVDSGLSAPRYGVTLNGKAYVTNHEGWETSTDDYLAIIDLETLEVEEKIEFGMAVEEIVEENGLLYIQNASFGTGNTISIFNPTTNSIEGSIEVADGLNSIEIEDERLYALSTGSLEVIDLNSNETVTEIIFPEELGGAQELEVEGGSIYYTMGTSVFEVGIGDTEPAETPLVTYESNSDYGVMYGFEVEGDRIFIADGGDFSSNSFVEIYDLKGELIETLTVGVGPNGIYWNN